MGVMGVLVGFGVLFTGARIHINIQKLVVADCRSFSEDLEAIIMLHFYSTGL